MAYPTLNPNVIFGTLYNMIISQQVMDPKLNSAYGALVNKFKVDGTLFGDTKLFYDGDVLASYDWLEDAEAENLLDINRPDAPECQAITLDQFRQINITTGDYLEKQAWMTPSAFQDFQNMVLRMIGETKKIHEETLFNAYVGTAQGGAAKSTVEIPLSEITATGEEKNRLEAQMIAKSVADVLADMGDYSRDYNDYGFIRAFDESELIAIWNVDFLNKITKLDLPTIFHKDGLLDKFGMEKLPARYFGEVNDAIIAKANNNGTYRSLVEADYTTATSVDDISAANTKHVFAGDLIPASTAMVERYKNGKKAAVRILGGIPVGAAYTPDEDVICKIVSKDTFKYMSAFEVGTSFFNGRSLTTNHYLTFGYSHPDRLLGQPLVTVHAD